MILLLDNYDSFTYNLYQYLGELGAQVEVVRNDQATLEELEAMSPERIVISPGPCTPKEAGVSVPLVKHFAGKTPILGVCLGLQSIGVAFGGTVAGALPEEVRHLAQQLFGNDVKKCASFTNRLLDICARARGKDFLLIHNPGGWGSTTLEELLQWERSVVDGVSTIIERLGYSWLLTQYFRSGTSWWAHMKDIKEEAHFFLKGKSSKARVMAAELKFIARHIKNLKVILIGASQGAAFSNEVMRQAGELRQVYSIELGIFFPHMSRRVVTERTLAIDSNGVMPDPMAHRNLKIGAKAYITAPFRWTRYRLQGKPEKFTYCINAPGHNYNWEYPEVQRQIIDFLETNFGSKSNLEVGVS